MVRFVKLSIGLVVWLWIMVKMNLIRESKNV